MAVIDRCTMPTGTLGRCSRRARYAYLKGPNALVVMLLCAQHDRSRNHARMLRPLPWEYDRKYDLTAKINITR